MKKLAYLLSCVYLSSFATLSAMEEIRDEGNKQETQATQQSSKLIDISWAGDKEKKKIMTALYFTSKSDVVGKYTPEFVFGFYNYEMDTNQIKNAKQGGWVYSWESGAGTITVDLSGSQFDPTSFDQSFNVKGKGEKVINDNYPAKKIDKLKKKKLKKKEDKGSKGDPKGADTQPLNNKSNINDIPLTTEIKQTNPIVDSSLIDISWMRPKDKLKLIDVLWEILNNRQSGGLDIDLITSSNLTKKDHAYFTRHSYIFPFNLPQKKYNAETGKVETSTEKIQVNLSGSQFDPTSFDQKFGTGETKKIVNSLFPPKEIDRIKNKSIEEAKKLEKKENKKKLEEEKKKKELPTEKSPVLPKKKK